MKRITSLFWLALSFSSLQAELPTRDLADFQIGINCHQYYAENLPLISDLGLKSGRIDVLWREVTDDKANLTPEAATLRRIKEAPLALSQTLAILCYGHPMFQAMGRPTEPAAIEAFSRFCSDTAGALRARTRFFEIWNEWNVVGMGDTPVSEGKSTPEDYVQLLKSSYHAVKKAVPDSLVLGGAMGGIGEHDDYLPRALKAGLLDYCDGLSIHPYFYGAKTPEARLPENAIPERINKLKGWLSDYAGGEQKPLYVTEIGSPTYGGDGGVSQDEQARNMVRSILVFALEPQAKGVWVYELRDGGSDAANREHHFGVVTRDGKPKAAYYALKDLVSLFRDAKSIERLPGCVGCFAVALEQKQGGKTYLAWTIDDDKSCFLEVEGLSAMKNPTLRTLGRFEFEKGEALSGGVRKTLGAMPLVITGLGDDQTLKIAAGDN